MSDFKLTPAQQAAVDTRNTALLVSAAAGSGKTRVLTERLMARVREGEDIDRFLVITFTRAAAAELRGRILTELNALAAQNPQERRLRRQSALLYRAQIGTIDSFCTNVVRENAHLLGVSPGFTVLDEERSRALLSRSLEDVLDRAYGTIEENAGLAMLVDSVGAGRDDARLAELVRSVYAQMQSRAWPEKWAAEKLDAMEVSELTDVGQTPWGRYLLADAAAEAAYRAREMDRALAVMAEPGNEPLKKAYGEAFEAMGLLFRDTARAAQTGWDDARRCAFGELPKLGRVTKFDDTACKERVKAAWDGGRDGLKKLQKTLAGDSRPLLAGIARSKPALTALMGLVSALDREYGARKRRADACDFSDVEHFCIRLLCEEDTHAPTALAGALSGRFAEVMVDEYQDVNAVQELIFQRVSAEGTRLFMVGDVKQSIYRFRLAEPSIFNGKFEEFASGTRGKRVLLRENFRSRGCVINACNAVFDCIMSPVLGEIEYNDEARLVQGAAYPEQGEVRAELCVIDPAAVLRGDDDDDDGESPDKVRLEAQYVAERIRAMVEAGELISDGHGGMRPVGYGDIAVLMRTPGTSGAAYRRALTEAGVPVNARQGGAFFSRPEVSFAVFMLAVADNPRQDVPLIAALRGLPFGFTPDELTAIRARHKGSFWDALVQRAGEDSRCAGFVELVNTLRDMAREESTESLLRWLYDRTGLMAACAVLPDGGQRIGNLMQLYEYARRFEQDGNRGLFRFVAWLRQLEERGVEPAAAPGGDAVQIMSIHKSKGLEFPVVFLADNSHQWNREGTGQVLCHSELGLGMRMTDSVRGVDWPTLPWRAIEKKVKMEALSEQIRVLYVAMTRARERLIMTCVQANAAQKLEKMRQNTMPVSPRVLASAQSSAQWLMQAAVCDGGKTICLRLADAVSRQRHEERPVRTAEAGDAALKAALEERVSWRYPRQSAVALPSKLTATEVKGAFLEPPDPESAQAVEPAREGKRRFRTPELGRKNAPLTGAERGIAEHLVMQYIDFQKTGSEAEIASEIERLRFQGFLDDRQAEAVPPEDIAAFFRAETGQRLLAAEHVTREFRFSLLCPAEQWFAEAPAGENVLLQGVMDCCMEENGALTILDFKTDGQIEPERYTGQLRAYAAAMERILQKPVKGAVLWYLRRKQAVWQPLCAGENQEKTVAYPEGM